MEIYVSVLEHFLLLLHFFVQFSSDSILLFGVGTNDPENRQVWAFMLEPVPSNQFHTIGKQKKEPTIPRILKELSGTPTPEKKDLANRVLVDW